VAPLSDDDLCFGVDFYRRPGTGPFAEKMTLVY